MKRLTLNENVVDEINPCPFLYLNIFREASAYTLLMIFFIVGSPAKDPHTNITLLYKPRLNQEIILTMHAVGNPVPSYHWTHGSKTIKSTDIGFISKVTIDKMDVPDFGNYTLTMTNKAGSAKYMYMIKADGKSLSG